MPEIHRIAESPAAFAGAVDAAVAALAAGRLVGLPTETVYGLAADARSPDAVAAIYRAKGRPFRNPLIAHVADVDAAARIAVLPEKALEAAAALWPGPLTLVVPLRAGAGLAPAVTAGLGTVAVRVPSRPIACAVLAAFAGPVAAPSANVSGRVTATTADHVVADLGEQLALVIDDGPSPVGVESTIVDLCDRPRILREGAIPAGRLAEVFGMEIGSAGGGEASDLKAPGMMASHYAPESMLRLDAREVAPGEALLTFGNVEVRGSSRAAAVRNLSLAGDPEEAAHNLFAHLRELDGSAAVIAVAPIPDAGLGAALNDRLRRAAAPRP